MKRSWFSAILIACSFPWLLSCEIINGWGPTIVDLGTVAEYSVQVEAWEETTERWVADMRVDVPQDWTVRSCDYTGTIAGTPIHGVGTVLDDPFPPYVCGWYPPEPGLKALRIRSEEHDPPDYGETGMVDLSFNVRGSVTQFTLRIGVMTTGLTFQMCSYRLYIDVEVRDSFLFLFGDSFESGDTSAWSAVVP